VAGRGDLLASVASLACMSLQRDSRVQIYVLLNILRKKSRN